MAGALFHYKSGPASYIAAGLIHGGKLVVAASGLSGSLASLNGTGVLQNVTDASLGVLGVAGADAYTEMLAGYANAANPVYPGGNSDNGDLQFSDGNMGYGPYDKPSFPVQWPGNGGDGSTVDNEPNVQYEDPLLDVSLLTYSIPVYNNVDINVTYSGSGTVAFGALLAANNAGGVRAWVTGDLAQAIVGRCTQPGGVTVATNPVGRAFIRV
jgi:hypothetical protein